MLMTGKHFLCTSNELYKTSQFTAGQNRVFFKRYTFGERKVCSSRNDSILIVKCLSLQNVWEQGVAHLNVLLFIQCTIPK